MAVRSTLRVLLTASIFTVACASYTASAQKAPNTQSAADATKKPACTANCPSPSAATKPPSAAEQFPFPGESSKSAASPSSPDPDAPTPSTPAVNPDKQFPFPGEPDSSSSSSSSSSANPDAATAPDPATAAPPDDVPSTEPKSTTRRKLPKVKQLQSAEDREAEDLTVARFYRDSGNLAGAYLRCKDAVKLQPDDPEAHFLLAETARKLNKRDEAIAEFNILLKLDASPDQIKTARKALAQFQ